MKDYMIRIIFFFLFITSSFSIANADKIINDIKVGELRIKFIEVKDSNCSSGKRPRIELEGFINNDAVFILEKLLKDSNNMCSQIATTVTLNSGGGFIEDGIQAGRLLRKYGVYTYVYPNDICYSSCSAIFLGGYYRGMGKNSELLMHSPYYVNDYSIRCQSDAEASNLRNYYIDMLGYDLGELLFNRTMSYCGTNAGWTLNDDAAEIFGLLN
jgi:hypothetical protein